MQNFSLLRCPSFNHNYSSLRSISSRMCDNRIRLYQRTRSLLIIYRNNYNMRFIYWNRFQL